MNIGTPQSTRPTPFRRDPNPHTPNAAPQPGRHRLADTTPAQFRAPYVVKVHQPDAGPAHLRPRRVRMYAPGVTSTQAMPAYTPGQVGGVA